MTAKCALSNDGGWVCDEHPGRAWDGPNACRCGAAGSPCPWCNVPAEEETPRMPAGFKTEVDKDGWRH